MKTNPFIKWTIAASLLFIAFLFFTPISVYNSWGIWLTIIQSALCGFLVFMTMAKLEHFNDLYYLQDDESGVLNKSATTLIPLGVFIFSLFILMSFFDFRIDSALLKYGITTKATVMDGKRTVSGSWRRKTESNKLRIYFKDSTGRERQYTTEISRDIFKQVAKGLEIEIKYLPDDPSIFKLMVGDENVQKFKGIENRDLAFQDIERLIALKPDQIKPYLDSISEGWEVQENQEGLFFANNLKKELVVVAGDGRLLIKGKIALDPERFIPKDRITSADGNTPERKSGYNVKTYQLNTMTIQRLFSISVEHGVDASLLVKKK